jgi:hypothetical protein
MVLTLGLGSGAQRGRSLRETACPKSRLAVFEEAGAVCRESYGAASPVSPCDIIGIVNNAQGVLDALLLGFFPTE